MIEQLPLEVPSATHAEWALQFCTIEQITNELSKRQENYFLVVLNEKDWILAHHPRLSDKNVVDLVVGVAESVAEGYAANKRKKRKKDDDLN